MLIVRHDFRCGCFAELPGSYKDVLIQYGVDCITFGMDYGGDLILTKIGQVSYIDDYKELQRESKTVYLRSMQIRLSAHLRPHTQMKSNRW